MVLNKPKYKPGDTVRVKAFIQSRSGIPVKAPLLLRLSGNYFAVDTILARLSPYRQGGYEGWFVLDNQLHLSLDQQYLLTLETLSSRKYEIGNDNGSLDKQEYALKRKVLIRCRFYYEDYELNTVRFFARSDRNEHSRGIPASLFLKAIDDNDMAVMDGRVQLLVRPSSVGKPQFHGHKVFLADTLWFKSRESGRKRITEQHALQKLLGALYPWPYRDFPFLTPR